MFAEYACEALCKSNGDKSKHKRVVPKVRLIDGPGPFHFSRFSSLQLTSTHEANHLFPFLRAPEKFKSRCSFFPLLNCARLGNQRFTTNSESDKTELLVDAAVYSD